MKRILTFFLLVVGTVCSLAQGTVNFVESADATILIYAPQSPEAFMRTTGNSAADTPAGNTAYTGPPIGGSSTGSLNLYGSGWDNAANWANGNNFTAQLYGTAGVATTFNQLSPLTQYTSTFATRPGGAGQFVGSSPSPDPGIPGVTGNTGATLSLAVWFNNAGTIQSLAAAQAADIPWGISPLFFINGPLGGQGVPPTPPPNLVGLQSFSLTYEPYIPLPEPGTISLVVAGVAAILLARRR